MRYLISASSDVGIKKENNQDSLMAKSLSIDGEEVALAVLCDGVGGLAKGEVASATVVKAFDKWFSERFPDIFYADNVDSLIYSDWQKLLEVYNRKIREFGIANNISLGTTITAILLLRERYYIVNIGDSRTYEISSKVRQLTKDQTIVEYELANGMLTPEQAEKDKRKSILLQCIGASERLIPDFFTGKIQKNTVFMLCSDGFRHLISEEEIYAKFQPDYISSAEQMKVSERELIELNKQRQEKDNISIITIKIL